MIRLQHKVQKGEFRLDVDVEIPDTGVTGIFGESGSGKTTLLRCIAGLEGEGGLPVHRRNIGYVFQQYHLLDDLTVAENLEVPLTYRKIKGAERSRLVDETLDRFGLGPKRRAEDLLADLARQGTRLSEEGVARLHGPAGLDLGGEGPEAIALSLVSEILAVSEERSGGWLRDRKGPIHEPGVK